MGERDEKGMRYLATYDGGTKKPQRDLTNGDMERLFYEHDGRLVHKWHHYFQVYDEILARYRNTAVRFLEIGVWKGGSLQLWRKFLGPSAVIFGIDIDKECAALDQPDLPVRIGSQSDPDFLKAIVAEMGGLDVVIDDGSHIGRDQFISFNMLFPMLSDGGLYVIEDTHSSYWSEWGGGYRRFGTAIEMGKAIVDDQHGWYHSQKPSVRANAKTEVASVSFFDSIIAIRKRRRGPPIDVKRSGR